VLVDREEVLHDEDIDEPEERRRGFQRIREPSLAASAFESFKRASRPVESTNPTPAMSSSTRC
jgi:hypothetical protein